MSRFTQNMRTLHSLRRAIGARSAIEAYVRRKLNLGSVMYATTGLHKLTIRPADSDIFLLAQIFGDRQYDAGKLHTRILQRIASEWAAAGVVPLIIDAGSNVGYSTLFFADVFPSATVIGVEPDARCAILSQRHCGGNPRIKIVNAALWRHADGVQLGNTEGPSWARRVLDAGSTPSVTLESLTATVPHSRPFLLKMDVEGSERDIFESSGETVKKFPCVMIEPHDWMLPGTGSLVPLFEAVREKEMDTLIVGENLMLIDSDLVRNAGCEGWLGWQAEGWPASPC